MARYETVMAKGYQYLADPDTKVDVNTAMIAAARLQALLDTRAGQPDMADTLVKVNRIIAAVKSMPPSRRGPNWCEGSRAMRPPSRTIIRSEPWMPPMRSTNRGNSTIWMTTKWMTTTGDRQPTRRWLIASGGRTSLDLPERQDAPQPLHRHTGSRIYGRRFGVPMVVVPLQPATPGDLRGFE